MNLLLETSVEQMDKCEELRLFLGKPTVHEAILLAVEWYPDTCRAMMDLMAEYNKLAERYRLLCSAVSEMSPEIQEKHPKIQQHQSSECIMQFKRDFPHFNAEDFNPCKGCSCYKQCESAREFDKREPVTLDLPPLTSPV